MLNSVYDIVVKIGSMALIHNEDGDLDYNIFSRLGKALKPGMLLVSSGATEIGRLDYISRNGKEAKGETEEVKTDYSAQGQPILMKNYVSSEENRKMEIKAMSKNGQGLVECVDNDETAAIIAMLVKARRLVILTTVNGIYKVRGDESTLIREVTGSTADELEENVIKAINYCKGASRPGANGAGAKLRYSIGPAKLGTHVYISSAENRIDDIVSGKAASTHIYLK